MVDEDDDVGDVVVILLLVVPVVLFSIIRRTRFDRQYSRWRISFKRKKARKNDPRHGSFPKRHVKVHKFCSRASSKPILRRTKEKFLLTSFITCDGTHMVLNENTKSGEQ